MWLERPSPAFAVRLLAESWRNVVCSAGIREVPGGRHGFLVVQGQGQLPCARRSDRRLLFIQSFHNLEHLMCTAQGLIGIARIEQIRWGRSNKRVVGLNCHSAQASERQFTELTDS